MTLTACVATMRGLDSCELAPALAHVDVEVVNNREANLGLVCSYQYLFTKVPNGILAYLHDDVTIYNLDWDDRVLHEFKDPRVGVVGFGGALRHGTADIYKRPYRLGQLAREGYLSNTDDAEHHGTRFTGSTEVAVLDGFALMVRKELLEKAGGWPVNHLKFHCYDYWVCCMAHRLGYTVRVAGEKCQHHGGRTSVSDKYQKWCEAIGTTDQRIHEESHRWIYSEFKDVLPYWVA